MAKTTAQKLPPMKKTAASKKPAAPKAEAPTTAPVAAPKSHARKAKPAEKDRIAERQRLAKSYLEQRDGMDPDTAQIVIDSMDAGSLDALIEEANTAVLARGLSAPAPSAPAASPVKAGDTQAAPDAEEDAKPPVDFLSVPALAADDTFPEIVIRCSEAARIKNEQEAAYKSDKKLIDSILAEAGIGKKEPVICVGLKLNRYTGKTPRQLNEQKLLLAGVSPDIIAKCWVSGTYDDVRITKVEG